MHEYAKPLRDGNGHRRHEHGVVASGAVGGLLAPSLHHSGADTDRSAPFTIGPEALAW